MSFSIFPNLADDLDVVEEFSMKLFNPDSVAIFSLAIGTQTSADFFEVVSIEETAPPTFSGKYEGNEFAVEIGLTISVPVDENDIPLAIVELIDFELYDYSVDCIGYSAKKVEDVIEVNGASLNVFTDQIYEFLMPDLSVKTLDANTTEDFISLVKWNPPSTKVRSISHKFTIIANYTEDSVSRSAILTLVMPQTIRWNYSSGIASFRQLLAKSRRV